jgi:branched-chain amino acid transport system ATP-binding protein
MNGENMKNGQSALSCQKLTKAFGGLEAVKDVDLHVTHGERRAIIGPNGAGKTTFFNLINGQHPVTSGSIELLGRNVTKLPTHKRAALGLGRTFQITNLFPTKTVVDNLVISAMGLMSTKFSVFKPLSSYRPLYDKAERALKSVGLLGIDGVLVKNLSYGEQRQVEIAMALINQPKVLLLDEPTAGLSPAESHMMSEIIQGLDPSITILIIEHDMDVALSVANYITVLHEGRVFMEGSANEVQGNAKVQEIYFGEE